MGEISVAKRTKNPHSAYDYSLIPFLRLIQKVFQGIHKMHTLKNRIKVLQPKVYFAVLTKKYHDPDSIFVLLVGIY